MVFIATDGDTGGQMSIKLTGLYDRTLDDILFMNVARGFLVDIRPIDWSLQGWLFCEPTKISAPRSHKRASR